jgi:ankyrin repeat protein
VTFYHGLARLCVIVVLSSCSLTQSKPSSGSPAVADPEGPSDSPLIQALAEGNEIRVRQLLDAGESPNRKDRLGTTPLRAAIVLHHPDLAELLVERGADVNETSDDKNAFPLMTAAWYCDLSTAKILLDRGAKVAHQSADGETPLGSAADACRNADMIKLLIAHGAEINSKTNRGRTPLIIAAFSGNEPAVRELVQAGADLNAKDVEGKTAESSACGRAIGRTENHDRICKFLRETTGR